LYYKGLILKVFFFQKWLRLSIQTVVITMFLSSSISGCGGGNGNSEDSTNTNSDVSLSGLTLTGIALEQAFQSDQLNYSANVDFSLDSITLTPVTSNTAATIQVNGVEVASGQTSTAIALVVGHNLIEILVTSDDGSATKIYTLDVLRASASSEATLSALILSGSELDQPFQAERTIYTASVDYTQEVVTLTPVATDTGATIRVNDADVDLNNGPLTIDLAEGENLINLVVTAENGVNSESYTLAVVRGSVTTGGSRPRLSGLSISGTELDQTFDPYRTIYTASANFSQDTIIVTPVDVHDDIDGLFLPVHIITVNGEAVAFGQSSEPITLALGQNLIHIQVTTQDGSATVIYTIAVYRITSPSSEASLSDLSLSSVSLEPLFQPNRTTYSTSVDARRSCAILTAVPAHTGAIIRINGVEAGAGDAITAIDLAEGENLINLEVTAEDGIATRNYTIAVFRQTISLFPLQTSIIADDGRRGDWFGSSVAISGDTLVVGADGRGLNTTGRAYVFTRNDGVWSQQANLYASNTEADDLFGSSVAISNDTLVVGAPYEASNVEGGESDNSYSRAGAAYVFTRSNGLWSQQAYLKAHNGGEGDYFGKNVAISGDTLVVAALREDSGLRGEWVDSAGAVYVFARSEGGWRQQAYLKASNPERYDYFGASVAIWGDTLIVGASGEDSSASGGEGDNSAEDAGAAYVFTRSGNVWHQQAYLKASNAEAEDRFGSSVSISNDTLVVGAYSEDGSVTGGEGDNSDRYAGAAYVFTRNGGVWTQQTYLKASNAEEADYFGASVAILNDTLVVGAYGEDSSTCGGEGDNSGTNTGAAYVFTRTGGFWSQQAYLKASNAEISDSFGKSVAISNNTLAIGAASKGGSIGAAYIWQ
jgi:hypothetical protein